MSEPYIKIIHYRSGLSFAQMQDFDEYDYKLASKKKFYKEKDAIAYGKQLARANGFTWYGGNFTGLLDE